MAIRINLLAESQAAEELRRKDPVKRGIWIGCFSVAVVLLYILKLQLDIHFSEGDYVEKEKSWKQNLNAYASVTNNQSKIVDLDKKLAALDRLSTNRFYWGTLLNTLQQTMIDDITVLHITGEQSLTKQDPLIMGSGSSKKIIPGSVVEKVTLYIDAKDYNSDAQNYNKFKETLCNNDYFVKNLGRKDGFILDGTLSAPTADPLEPSKQFVTFRLTSHFKEVRHE